jgi:acyl-coenzyme A synthetase/AMP-(fatty) acid ligase
VADRNWRFYDHTAAHHALKPGSATLPFFGIDVDVVDEHGQPVKAGEEGYLVIKKPWPGMLRTIYRDPERYAAAVLEQVRKYVPDRRFCQAKTKMAICGLSGAWMT